MLFVPSAFYTETLKFHKKYKVRIAGETKVRPILAIQEENVNVCRAGQCPLHQLPSAWSLGYISSKFDAEQLGSMYCSM